MGKARSGVVRRPLVGAPSSLKTGFDLRGRGGGALAFRELSPRFLEPRDECVHLIRGNHDLVLVLLKLILLRDHYLPSTSTRMSAALTFIDMPPRRRWGRWDFRPLGGERQA